MGDVIVQKYDNKYIFHIVTKEESTSRDIKWKNFKTAVNRLAKQCEELGVKNLAVPKIGAGLDGMHWPKNMRLLNQVFNMSKTEVTICYLSKKQETDYRSGVKSKRIRNKPEKSNKKIYMLGDSHVKNVGIELNIRTPSDTKCFANAKSGATSNEITKDLNYQVAHLTPEDILVYMSGANDIAKNEQGRTTINMEDKPKQYVMSHAMHTNVIMVTVPKNCNENDVELHAAIDVYNQNLMNTVSETKQQSKFPERIKLLDINEHIQKMHLNKKGVHLNKFGKEVLAQEIVLLGFGQ